MTSEPSTKMTIHNVPWKMAELFANIHRISKPKFQRDQKWTVVPVKENAPNYKEYIQFLLKNRHSVFPISLGTEIHNNREQYIVIDGNNRINAIVHFLTKPYDLFSEYYDPLILLLSAADISPEDKSRYVAHIQGLSYHAISTFRRLDEIFPECNLPASMFRKIEDEMVRIQKKMLFPDNTAYDTTIEFNINIFKNGTSEEYCEIFEEINKHANTLSKNEILSAVLFSTIVQIDDPRFRHELLVKIKEYYDERGKKEALEQYNFVIQAEEQNINAFDFMIGFQNLCAAKYPGVPPFEASGLSLFFKMYKLQFRSIERPAFTPENMAQFIDDMIFTCDVFHAALATLFPPNVNEKIFNKCSIKYKNLIKTSPIVIIFTTILTNRSYRTKDTLVKKITLAILYHVLSNRKFLKNLTEEEYSVINVDDHLEYKNGGVYIDRLCQSIAKDKRTMIFDIPEASFTRLLRACMQCNLGESEERAVRVRNTRRHLNFLDKILLCNYWNRNVPNKFLSNAYSLEHITPFSSVWTGKVDIDRIGNLFPTFEEINRERGNGDLAIYITKVPEFCSAIRQILPLDQYSKINCRKDRKTTIVSVDMYNEYCERNEAIYLNNLVDELYH